MSNMNIDARPEDMLETYKAGVGDILPSKFAVEPPRRIRNRAMLAAGMAVIILIGAAWFLQSRQILPANRPMGSTPSGQVITLVPQAVFSELNITGTIEAGRSVAVVAPFDGVIREKRVQLGDHVDIGDVLVVMDTSEIASRYRDAQSANLKAAMAAETLEKWENGPDMQRAKRTLQAAESALASVERQVVEIKALFDQGIVSRNEYDGIAQQRDSQITTVAGARDDLAATVERGDDSNRKLVALELENTQSRLADLKQQMAGAKVATAVAGVLSRAPSNSASQTPASIEPGASLTRGTAIFSIADTSSFIVTGTVDEVDVNRVKLGQAVTIVSDALPGAAIPGEIVGVSAEAGGEKNYGRAASYEVRASFSTNDAKLRQSIRIGMSARMTIQTYANPEALVVPADAIMDPQTTPFIKLRRNGETIAMPVLLGETFPRGVEVVSGLHPGDQIIAP